MVNLLVELAGFAAIVVGAFMLAIWFGFFVCGGALIIIANMREVRRKVIGPGVER